MQPAPIGLDMLVPTLISDGSNGGTVDRAVPGAIASGFATSPPRLEERYGWSRRAPAPNWSRVPACERRFPIENAKRDAAGVPLDDTPGPSLPLEQTKATPGCLRRNVSMNWSMSLSASSSLPMPYDMLRTSGRFLSSAHSAA